MCQELQTITDYKGKSSCVVPTEASLPEKLNTFYARFEKDNTEPFRRTLAAPVEQVLSLAEADLTKNSKKS